jgi:hypothetical protein
MSAESRRLLVLGVLACFLGGYTYLTAPEKKGLDTQREQKTERPVLDFPADQVTHIDLLFDGEHVRCQRIAEGWQQLPSGRPLRAEAVDEFLENLQKLVNLGEVDIGNASLSEYGLHPPSSQVVLQLADGSTRSLALGNRNPVQTSMYAQANEAPQVVLVGAVILWDMRKLVIAANGMG